MALGCEGRPPGRAIPPRRPERNSARVEAPGTSVYMEAMLSDEWSSEPPVRRLIQGASKAGSRSCLTDRRWMSSLESPASTARRMSFWKASRVPFISKFSNKSSIFSKCSTVSRSLTPYRGWAATWVMPFSRR